MSKKEREREFEKDLKIFLLRSNLSIDDIISA